MHLKIRTSDFKRARLLSSLRAALEDTWLYGGYMRNETGNFKRILFFSAAAAARVAAGIVAVVAAAVADVIIFACRGDC